MKSAPIQFSLRVVLVRPRNPLNIGAAARAMANFGFDDMVAVKPYAPIWKETKSAVGAEKLVLDARAVYSLDEAIGDCHFVFGTTTAKNRTLKRPLVRLPELNCFLKAALSSGVKKKAQKSTNVLRVAVMFGSEKTGLSNRYLDRCHAILTVPTDVECPSMNLSQAVAVCCYEFSRMKKSPGLAASGRDAERHRDAFPTVEQMRQLVKHVQSVFSAAGFLPFLPPKEQEKKIWRTFLQWKLRRADLALMHGFLRFVLKKGAMPPHEK